MFPNYAIILDDERKIDALITAALDEDMPDGDITSENLIRPKTLSRAVLVAKQAGVLAGIDIARRVFRKLDPRTSFNRCLGDGQAFERGDVLAEIEGRAVVLLKGERTALNFLQRLSGIATTTRRFVDAVAGTKARILDTRKTTPGLRALEKYAVRMGGGENHRLNLSSMVLIKDNHLDDRRRHRAGRAARPEENQARTSSSRSKSRAFDQARSRRRRRRGLDHARQHGPAADEEGSSLWTAGRAKIEASGNVEPGHGPENRRARASIISRSGKLTHSFASVDLSLEFLGGLAAQRRPDLGAKVPRG